MPTRVRDWLLFPVRTPARAALAAAVALLALAGWHGLRVLRFHRDQAAAREALAMYDFPEARQRLAACLNLRRNDPAVLLLAAQAARRDGLLDEAQGHLDRYREQVGGSTPEGALQSALLRVQRGQVQDHVHALIDQLEVRHPDSEQILEALAQGCVHVYRLDEASFWTKQLLDRFPRNPVGRLIDAQTYETLRRRERAVEILSRLVEDFPGNDKARLDLAGLLFKRDQYEEAARHYQQLHNRQPDQAQPLLGLARCWHQLGRTEQLRDLLRQLEAQHPENSDVLVECGQFALQDDRPGDAERLLRRAVQLAPNDRDAHYQLALCLHALNQPDESQRHMQRCKQIEADLVRLKLMFETMVKAPADPAPRLEAGQICLRNGQVQEGLRWLYGVLEMVPDHKPTHAALADYFNSQGDSQQGEYHRQRAR